MKNFNKVDIFVAFLISLLAVGLAAYLYSLSGLLPGFVLPLGVSVIAGFVNLFVKHRKGLNLLVGLPAIDKQFVALAIGATLFGLLMPILFPSGAYEYAKWLVYVNSIFLVAGITSIPVAKGLALLVIFSARIRGRYHSLKG